MNLKENKNFRKNVIVTEYAALSKYTNILCLLANVNIWFGAFSYGHVGTGSSPPGQVKLDYDNDNGPRMMRYKCLDKWL